MLSLINRKWSFGLNYNSTESWLLFSLQMKTIWNWNRQPNNLVQPCFRPCILIFDSLQSCSRAKVAATLRDYLACEYQEKVGKERVFTKETMRGCCPKVPQQPNFSDCGIFVLQYIQSFFEVRLNYFIWIGTALFTFLIHRFLWFYWSWQVRLDHFVNK